MIKPSAFLLIAVACAVTLAGLAVYPGAWWIFIVFSAACFLLIASAVKDRTDYPHLFFAAMLFTGLWLKSVVCLALGIVLQEPVGNFDYSPERWDRVLLVAAVGVAGYLAGRLLVTRFVPAQPDQIQQNSVRNLGALWAFAIIAAGAIAALNFAFGLMVRGHVPAITLPWPLGGLLAVSMDIGIPLVFVILMSWTRVSNGAFLGGFFALCAEAVVMSVATLSRALYPFHTFPFILTEIPDQWRRRRLRASLIVATWAAFAAAVPLLTSMQRLYTPEVIPSVVPTKGGTGYLGSRHLQSQFVAVATNLLLLRWPGLEGLMATTTYDGKSAQLWSDAAFHRRGHGHPDLYTEKISGSGYTKEMSRRDSYATLAGPIAFFYFSGSLFAVFVGMGFVATALRLIGRLWERLAQDRLALATTGWYLAFIAVQLSGGLQQALVGPVFVTAVYCGAIAVRRFVGSTGAGQQPVLSKTWTAFAFPFRRKGEIVDGADR